MTHADRPIPAGLPVRPTLADLLQDEEALTDLERCRVAANLGHRGAWSDAHQIRAAWEWAKYSVD